jgi:beta-phosphoglucomutase-like phosphatase (HAD superfamily)
MRAVIFDFDGVLADTEGLHLAAFQQVFAARGWSLSEHEYFEHYMGFDDEGVFVEYARNRALALDRRALDEAKQQKADAFAVLVASGRLLYPGAAECVTALAGAYPLAIASGALHHEIESILSESGLLSHFALIVGADDVGARKPAPDPYLAAAAGLGVDPRECVAIEDSTWGLRSAQDAGMRTIAVTTTSAPHILRGADRVIAGVHELTVELIRGLGVRS